MAVNSVKFLHWIGFNPTSDLPPPNEEVTHALAFLGYDIIGKIVEKVRLITNHSSLSVEGHLTCPNE